MKKLILSAVAIFAFSAAFADIAPTPQISYTFNYLTAAPLSIDPDHSEQIQCEDNQCMNAEPLGTYGIQKLYCNAKSCYVYTYQFKPFQKLVVQFSDGKKRETPVFKAPSSIRTAMQVNVKEDSLDIITLPQKPAADSVSEHHMLTSLSITIALEVLAGLLYLLAGGLPLTVLIFLAISNLITIPFTWLVLSDFISNMGILWIFNFVAELIFVYVLAKNKMSFKNILGLVMMANIASYVFGLIIVFMMASM